MTFQIGVRVARDTGPLLAEVSSVVDYVLLEFMPGSALSPWQLYALDALGKSKAVTLHGFHSLSSPGIFTQEVIGPIQEAVDRSGASWYSEHICFALINAEGSDVVTLAAPLDDETLQAICENAAVLREHLSVPLLLENLGRPIIWPWDDIDEIDAVHQIVNQTGCELVLDLAQAATSAATRGQSLLDYVMLFPHGRIREIHIGPDGTEIGQEYLEVLQALLRAGPFRAVTVEGAEEDYQVALRCIEQLRDLSATAG
ncbi:MAG TPA: DUF692 family protein [Chloroflexia bacterium]|jgi:uncharacterized protein (UPF0276 family)